MTEFESAPAYQEAKYLTSAAEFDQLPPDQGAEIAFIGRSNAGKSSALNIITGIKGLARTSKTPGRTQMINFFALNEHERLVDLPGYGYAKVPRMVQKRWEELVDSYLKNRRCLKGLVVVMDIRHPLKEMDEDVIEWAVNYDIPIHILLTKSDKLSQNAAKKTLGEVQTAISAYGEKLTLQLFSSHDRTGLDEVKAVLSQWFRSEP
ncbi:ribosome biogenesis GTP-binding protein YihA/YsxC [Coxiella burnetii]|uniref:Probable GTP-binding protein EngB n=1 Tax=Coxiella burnetii (strain RSA 331 / Henzerling II) TaxID=360115 RepID=ENGB_COXBR|nr:ribosome biogenesis GTP-binding protein YihA/YsxC [Coxiella burnetii]A9NAD8.1 RecName: Full=Probable GTP-binding protein EngB [Coxiella burnetii RSA 331]ABX77710.1 GTP-binding protein [Coxiella burnetii RSA 331]AML48328.1 GTP-binding protein [Coxiella burnetii]AML54339.1 GTP-binding protein [Coxiella burnetii]ARI66532.1 GTP-binding protein [Coxiella burnetii]ARK27974.1 YihA family ribosome biogenesis GTP-binding protein [Coxiella burnetii]